MTVLTLTFNTSTFIISPPSLPKTLKTILSTLSGFKFKRFFATLWLYKNVVHPYQKVYALFYYDHFQSKLYQRRLFVKNIIYIMCKSRRCLIVILMWVLILTVLTILTSVAVLMITLYKSKSYDNLPIFYNCNLSYISK